MCNMYVLSDDPCSRHPQEGGARRRGAAPAARHHQPAEHDPSSAREGPLGVRALVLHHPLPHLVPGILHRAHLLLP